MSLKSIINPNRTTTMSFISDNLIKGNKIDLETYTNCDENITTKPISKEFSKSATKKFKTGIVTVKDDIKDAYGVNTDDEAVDV